VTPILLYLYVSLFNDCRGFKVTLEVLQYLLLFAWFPLLKQTVCSTLSFRSTVFLDQSLVAQLAMKIPAFKEPNVMI
jgi:hypothetical protein